jgi:hypothetical protein
MNHTRIGIDLAKNVFHMIVLGPEGKVIKRRKFSRAQLAEYVSQLEPATIAKTV